MKAQGVGGDNTEVRQRQRKPASGGGGWGAWAQVQLCPDHPLGTLQPCLASVAWSIVWV